MKNIFVVVLAILLPVSLWAETPEACRINPELVTALDLQTYCEILQLNKYGKPLTGVQKLYCDEDGFSGALEKTAAAAAIGIASTHFKAEYATSRKIKELKTLIIQEKETLLRQLTSRAIQLLATPSEDPAIAKLLQALKEGKVTVTQDTWDRWRKFVTSGDTKELQAFLKELHLGEDAATIRVILDDLKSKNVLPQAQEMIKPGYLINLSEVAESELVVTTRTAEKLKNLRLPFYLLAAAGMGYFAYHGFKGYEKMTHPDEPSPDEIYAQLILNWDPDKPASLPRNKCTELNSFLQRSLGLEQVQRTLCIHEEPVCDVKLSNGKSWRKGPAGFQVYNPLKNPPSYIKRTPTSEETKTLTRLCGLYALAYPSTCKPQGSTVEDSGVAPH